MLPLSNVDEKLIADLEKMRFSNNSKKLTSLLGDHFHYVKHIGSGEGGEVYLCRYTGSDENIKKLCDAHSRLCVKIASRKNALNHEAAVIDDLYKKHSAISKDLKFVVGIPVKEKEDTAALLINYVSFNDSPAAPLEYSLKSFLKSFYHAVVNGSVAHKHLSDKCHQGLYDDIGIMLVQLINQMQSIVMQLHELGYIHLDIASRNFVLNKPVVDGDGNILELSLVLCDYGLSGKLNNQGIVNTQSQQNMKPITARNYQDIVDNIATTRTDIFALKTAIIGMISMVVTDLMQDYNILSVGQNSTEHFKILRTSHEYFRNDNIVMSEYLSKLLLFIDNCPERHVKNHIKYLILYYREYLLTLPKDDLNVTEATYFDRFKLLSANEKYITSIIDNKIEHFKDINNKNELQALLLSLRRLLTIPVSEAFRKSVKYQEISAIDNSEKLRSYLAEKIKIKKEKRHVHEGISNPTIDEKSPQVEWVDKLNKNMLLWFESRKENMQEIKWFGEEMKTRVTDIINDIMSGNISQLSDAQNKYIEIARDIAHKIHEKHNIQSSSAQGNQKGLVAKVGIFVSGYEGEQGKQSKEVLRNTNVKVSGYEGEQLPRGDDTKSNKHKKKRDL